MLWLVHLFLYSIIACDLDVLPTPEIGVSIVKFLILGGTVSVPVIYTLIGSEDVCYCIHQIL